MEEKNEKGKNTVIGILIGIIVCLVIALIFVSYSKFIGKDENKNSNSINNNSAETDDNKNNAVDNNNDTITLDEIKEKYQINKGTGGQFGTVHESIVDKQTNTTIINNLQEFSQSSVYLLKNKGKVYFYVEGLNVFDGPLKSRLYDEKGNIIFDISNKYKFHLIFKDGEPNYTTNVFEVDGAYYTENGIINKYNLDGTKISNSLKYDDVIQVDQKYSLIYQSNDNSVYVISNDGNYSQKITTLNNSGYCMNDFSKNTNIADNKFIYVYLSDCPEPDGPIDYYKLDLVNNSVTFQKGY